MIDAIIFNLDGVILETEQLWNQVREGLVRERGGRWSESAQADMMGMSSTEWSRYMHDVLGVPDPTGEISREVVRRMGERYAERLPLLEGAAEAVRRLAARWPLGLASSSNRELIESEEVERGKPAPDVYLEAARRLGVEPARCAAIEDSASGIRSARAAEMLVVAIPNPDFPPPAEVLALAAVVLESIEELAPETLTEAARLSTASSD